jgi:hypothetical protein
MCVYVCIRSCLGVKYVCAGVCTVLYGRAEVGRGHGVIDDQRNVRVVRDVRQTTNVAHNTAYITHTHTHTHTHNTYTHTHATAITNQAVRCHLMLRACATYE